VYDCRQRFKNGGRDDMARGYGGSSGGRGACIGLEVVVAARVIVDVRREGAD
jgi:hypothetical protein